MAATEIFARLDAGTFDHAYDVNTSDVVRFALLAAIYELNQ